MILPSVIDSMSWTDWILVAIALPLAPFALIALVSPTLAVYAFVGLFKMPWRSIARTVHQWWAENSKDVQTAAFLFKWFHRIDRLTSKRRR